MNLVANVILFSTDNFFFIFNVFNPFRVQKYYLGLVGSTMPRERCRAVTVPCLGYGANYTVRMQLKPHTYL